MEQNAHFVDGVSTHMPARYGHAQDLGVLIAVVADMERAEVAEIWKQGIVVLAGDPRKCKEKNSTPVAEDRMSTRAPV